MRPAALAIPLAALLGCAAPPAPPPPPAAVAVAVEWAPAPAPASPAERSLRRFAESWMRGLRRVEADNRRAAAGRDGHYTGYSREFTTELKATGRREVPFVGLIRYQERLYHCLDVAMRRCDAVWSLPVTEIFRFQDGRWIY